MAVTDFAAAFGVSPKVAATLIAALEKRGAYVLADADDSRTITMGNCLYLIFNGRLFHYDASDATTAHDGVTCCVSFEGKRYKADGFGGGLLRIFSIQSKTLTAPPGSPTIGQQWIVAVGGTGAWAGKDNYIASWTARGWVFSVPNTYDLAMNAADSKYYNFAVSNTWVAGLPAVVLGASTISPSALKYGRFGLPIVNQTTNTPPVSPSDGYAYIIGGTPTGAWAGNARNIAIYETSAWVIYSQYNGAKVFDISINAEIVSNGTTWSAAISGYSAVIDVATNSLQQSGIYVALNTSNYYTYQSSTPPPISNTHDFDQFTLTYSAKKAGATLEFSYDALLSVYGSTTFTMPAPVTFTLAIFVDSASTAADWKLVYYQTGTLALIAASFSLQFPVSAIFKYVVPDQLSHTYTIVVFGGDAGAVGGCGELVDFSRRKFILRERA